MSNLAIQKSPTRVNPVGLTPLLALGVESGLFILVATPASFAPVNAFARFESEPIPRFVGVTNYLHAQSLPSGQSIYTAFIRTATPPVGLLQLGCVTDDQRKPVFQVDCQAYTSLDLAAMKSVIDRFGRALTPAFIAVLPADHVLCQNLEITDTTSPPGVEGSLDGVLEGHVHGWIVVPGLSQKTIPVELFEGEKIVSLGIADFYLDKLNGESDPVGRYRFRLALSYSLFDGAEHQLLLRANAPANRPIELTSALTLIDQRSLEVDLISRENTLEVGLVLGQKASVKNTRAITILHNTFSKACLQQETGLMDEARADYQRLNAILGDNALCHCKIGETWLLQNMTENALQAYQRAVQLDPRFVWAQLGFGQALQRSGMPLKAEAAYLKALQFNPNSALARQRLIALRHAAIAARLVQLVQANDKTAALSLLEIV
jgi:hypothetical protein